MAKAWVINSRGLARKIKNPRKCAIKDLALQAIRECPNCKCPVDNSDAPPEWPGLPAGVKFDPSDTELLEHLAGKVDREKSTPHMFIDEFIPTLEQSGGICYTHPENLPGVKKDGSSTHFFHRTSNAYCTGQRKRRKVHISVDYSEGHARWHKTGKTRPVIENGTQKGIKKIMVLYERSKKGFKPVKTNWVMHQYHLGTEEDERDGQLVVSKIFYQTQVKHTEEVNSIDLDQPTTSVSPRTPKTRTPTPSRKKRSYDEGDEDKISGLTSQAMRSNEEELAQDQNPDMDDLIISLECDEVLDPIFPLEEPWPYTWHDTTNRKENWPSDLLDLNGIDTSTPPDFNLADLQFGSQDSFMSWLDWM